MGAFHSTKNFGLHFGNNNNKIHYQIKKLNLIYNIIYKYKKRERLLGITKKLIELSKTR